MTPLLIKIVLATKNKNYREQLNVTINRFFQMHFNDQNGIADQTKLPVYLNKTTIKTMLNVVECIRLYNQK